jgi:hypothetical protein
MSAVCMKSQVLMLAVRNVINVISSAMWCLLSVVTALRH